MTRITIVRHGHVQGIAPERFRGRQDLPLTDLGRKQAASTAQRIHASSEIAVVYSSPLSRCLDTARAIASACHTDVVSLPGLVDIDYGQWQGLTPDAARSRWPEALDRWFRAPHLTDIPGGEALAQVQARVTGAMMHILDK